MNYNHMLARLCARAMQLARDCWRCGRQITCLVCCLPEQDLVDSFQLQFASMTVEACTGSSAADRRRPAGATDEKLEPAAGRLGGHSVARHMLR